MHSRLVVGGNAVYETDEECLKQRRGKKEYRGKNRGTRNPFSPRKTGEADK